MRIKEITPKEFRCGVGLCPAVFETERGTLLIVGRAVTDGERAALPGVKVGPDEVLIEVPLGLLAELSAATSPDD